MVDVYFNDVFTLLLLRESHVLLYNAQIEPAIIFSFLRGGEICIAELQRERLT